MKKKGDDVGDLHEFASESISLIQEKLWQKRLYAFLSYISARIMFDKWYCPVNARHLLLWQMLTLNITPIPKLILVLTLTWTWTKKKHHYPHSNFLMLEISLQEHYCRRRKCRIPVLVYILIHYLYDWICVSALSSTLFNALSFHNIFHASLNSLSH